MMTLDHTNLPEVSQEIVDIMLTDDFRDDMRREWHLPTNSEMNHYHTITQEQYDEFIFYFPMYALKGWRYGQAFCEHFKITPGGVLYNFSGQEICERWIRDNYLVRHETKIC